MLNALSKAPEKLDYVQIATPVSDAAQPVSILPPSDIDAIFANVEKNQTPETAGLAGPPELVKPNATATDSSIYVILAALQEVLRDGNLAASSARANLGAEIGMQRYNTMEEAAQAAEQAKQRYSQSTQDLVDANKDLELADSYLDGMKIRLQMAQNDYDAKQFELIQQQKAYESAPQDPRAKEKFDAAQAAFDAARQTRDTALQNYDAALAARNTAAATALTAAQNVVTAQDAMQFCLDELARIATEMRTVPTIPVDTVEKAKSNLQVLLECVAILSDIMSKCNQEKLDAQLKLFLDQQKALGKHWTVKSVEFHDALDRIAALQKKFGRIGKIMNWGGIAAAIVATVMTGGAAAPMMAMAATLAFAITDMVRESQDKTTLTDMIMTPVMEWVTGATAYLANELGLSDEEAEAVAAFLAIVAVAAALYAAGSIANKALSNTALGAALNKPLLKSASGMMESIGSNLMTGIAIAQVGNALTMAGMQVFSAYQMKSAKESEAELTKTNGAQEVIKRVIQELVDNFCKGNNDPYQLMRYASDWVAQDVSTGNAIINNFQRA